MYMHFVYIFNIIVQPAPELGSQPSLMNKWEQTTQTNTAVQNSKMIMCSMWEPKLRTRTGRSHFSETLLPVVPEIIWSALPWSGRPVDGDNNGKQRTMCYMWQACEGNHFITFSMWFLKFYNVLMYPLPAQATGWQLNLIRVLPRHNWALEAQRTAYCLLCPWGVGHNCATAIDIVNFVTIRTESWMLMPFSSRIASVYCYYVHWPSGAEIHPFLALPLTSNTVTVMTSDHSHQHLCLRTVVIARALCPRLQW